MAAMDLSGSLTSVGFAALLDLVASSRKSGRLRLWQGRWSGEFGLLTGHVVSATIGEERGLAAAEVIALALPHAQFVFIVDAAPGERNLDVGAHELGALLATMAAPATTESRPLLETVPCVLDVLASADRFSRVERQDVAKCILEDVDGQRTVEAISARHGLAVAVKSLVELDRRGLITFAAPGPTAPSHAVPAPANTGGRGRLRQRGANVTRALALAVALGAGGVVLATWAALSGRDNTVSVAGLQPPRLTPTQPAPARAPLRLTNRSAGPAAMPGGEAAAPTPSAAAAAATAPQPQPTPAVDQAWQATLAAIAVPWGSDWTQVIEHLAAFRRTYPDHKAAREKLYAALLFSGQDLGASGNLEAGRARLDEARALMPEHGEAETALQALTAGAALPTKQAQAAAPPLIPSSRSPRQPVDVAGLQVTAPAAAPTKQPFVPPAPPRQQGSTTSTAKQPFVPPAWRQ